MIDLNYITNNIRSEDRRSKFFLERYIKRVVEYSKIEIPQKAVTHIHHIVPRWLGGSNDTSNLIRVTVRQHLYLHKLLHQVCRSRQSLAAVNAFTASMKSHKDFYKVQSAIGRMFYDDYIEMQSSLTKGSLWVTKDGVDTRASGDRLIELLMGGWVRGRSNKKVNGFRMVFDKVENKNVKIPKEEYDKDPTRYTQSTTVAMVDLRNQPDFPYLQHFKADSSEVDNINTFRLNDIGRLLKDGRFKHKDHITDQDELNYVRGRDLFGGRFMGVYHTPYGLFSGIWDFLEKTKIPRNNLISLCRTKVDKKVTKRWADVAKHSKSPVNDDWIGKTPREMGWYFTPKDEVTLELLKEVYPDIDISKLSPDLLSRSPSKPETSISP